LAYDGLIDWNERQIFLPEEVVLISNQVLVSFLPTDA
jgi:hypothetical protein